MYSPSVLLFLCVQYFCLSIEKKTDKIIPMHEESEIQHRTIEFKTLTSCIGVTTETYLWGGKPNEAAVCRKAKKKVGKLYCILPKFCWILTFSLPSASHKERRFFFLSSRPSDYRRVGHINISLLQFNVICFLTKIIAKFPVDERRGVFTGFTSFCFHGCKGGKNENRGII